LESAHATLHEAFVALTGLLAAAEGEERERVLRVVRSLTQASAELAALSRDRVASGPKHD
jgi:hypothetical protein